MNKLYMEIRGYENHLENKDIKILYRYFDPNNTYSRKYNILTDGKIEYIDDRLIKVSKASLVFNIDKHARVIYVWTTERKNIINKKMIKKVSKILN